MTRIFVRYHETAGPIIIEQNGQERNARKVEILGPSRIVYKPAKTDHPRIFIETEAECIASS